MSKLKHKPTESPSKKPKSAKSFGAHAQVKESVSRSEAERSKLVAQVWQQEVEQLSSQRFKSVEAAISAIASKVSERLHGDAEMESFLRLMLETDPGLQDELRKVLRIEA
jgi:hypothetical protein